MSDLTVKTDVFEGPLDLLLHLIQKLELDIYDIPIAEVTSQYMEYIHAMKELQLDIAGEYLVMAATLMSIKSAMLLPRKEAIDEFEEEAFLTEEDPRDSLTAMLLEYQAFKRAAQQLDEKQQERRLLYSKEPSDLSQYQVNVQLRPNQAGMNELMMAFANVLKRKSIAEAPPKVVEAEEVSIHEKMNLIEERLRSSDKGKVFFAELFESPNKREVVTVFLALLELVKENKIQAEQEESYGDIVLSFYSAQG